MLNRFTARKLGHDCVRHPCGVRGCGTHPGASHGVGSETWIYAVADAEFALSLNVLTTDRYPASVPPDPRHNGSPYMPSLHMHVVREASPNCECEYLGHCRVVDSGYLVGESFWNGHAMPRQFEQTEEFWRALEVEHGERRDYSIALSRRVDPDAIDAAPVSP